MISYAICTHNEGKYLVELCNMLLSNIDRASTEIVILDDYSNDEITLTQLEQIRQYSFVNIQYKEHTGDFSEQKNYLGSLCSGEWIVNLDADENVSREFILNISDIIQKNPIIEAYRIPRINIVNGLTQRHMDMWGWNVSFNENIVLTRIVTEEELDFLNKCKAILYVDSENEFEVTYNVPLVMWPDYQTRVYKNSPEIVWKNKVHEQLVGYKAIGSFPDNILDYCILHVKEIERQEQQNKFYNTLV